MKDNVLCCWVVGLFSSLKKKKKNVSNVNRGFRILFACLFSKEENKPTKFYKLRVFTNCLPLRIFGKNNIESFVWLGARFEGKVSTVNTVLFVSFCCLGSFSSSSGRKKKGLLLIWGSFRNGCYIQEGVVCNFGNNFHFGTSFIY